MRYKVTPDQAFHLLAQTSMYVNTKLREVADHLVHTGELPIEPRRTPLAGSPGRGSS